jgi:hypothetical protein
MKKSKKLPRFKTDKEVEKFMELDLSGYINKENLKPVTFEFAPKDKSITLRMSSNLLKAVHNIAKERGIPYQKIIREALEDLVKKSA